MYIELAYYPPPENPFLFFRRIKARLLLPLEAPHLLSLAHSIKAAIAPRTSGAPVATTLAAPPALKEVFNDVDGDGVTIFAGDCATVVTGDCATVVAGDGVIVAAGSVAGTLGVTVGATDSATDVAVTEGRI